MIGGLRFGTGLLLDVRVDDVGGEGTIQGLTSVSFSFTSVCIAVPPVQAKPLPPMGLLSVASFLWPSARRVQDMLS